MKLGLLTAALPRTLAGGMRGLGGGERLRRDRDRLLAGRRGHGAALRRRQPYRRRYPDDAQAQADPGRCSTQRGLTISSLAYYPNNLHPDPEHRERSTTTCAR